MLLGTGISCKEKDHKEYFQMCLSLIKVWISCPLQTKLVDGSKFQFENFPCKTFPSKMSLCHAFNLWKEKKVSTNAKF